MFEYIKGILISKSTNKIVVENNSIGYLLLCSQRTINALPEVDTEVKMFTKLIHREDTMYLCGFAQNEDKVIFDILTTVSGVGVKVALALLDEFSVSELVEAVISNDYKMISRAKGIGPKMAQKIILELKDKLTNTSTTLKIISSNASNDLKINEDTILEVQTMLQNLGWSSNEYKNAIQRALEIVEKDSAEDILRESLKILST